jgi:hypothetical protein
VFSGLSCELGATSFVQWNELRIGSGLCSADLVANWGRAVFRGFSCELEASCVPWI